MANVFITTVSVNITDTLRDAKHDYAPAPPALGTPYIH